MTPGNLELVEILVSWATTLPAAVAVIVWDERHLPGDLLARAWPPVSRDAAIFGTWNLGVHPVCVLLHFARTRRTFLGTGLGLLWAAAVLCAGAGAELAVATAIEWLGI
ncbi:MAG: hypothetical protein M3O50_02920 [Myxococcota bacterium]|nr:hypothetical protein [Myxococcota bacterium]